MAFSLSLPFPVTSKVKNHLKLHSRITSPANFNARSLHRLKFNSINIERRSHRHSTEVPAAAGDVEADSDSATSELNEEREQKSSESVEVSDVGAEIKKAMREREEREKGGGIGDLWSGVMEEIGEIEWPGFGKVLGTTGVVLGVIAGSSVVLLTVNAVLAELSDSIFAGKGVQDFFG
ncbi:hypothetical protein RJ641_004049 [Dillenia turbinata]|uniref:Preprotein translocase subunit SECE1 n=1 Tax=Dillenia turbinata TaxID=194707 RepID=A0AAN8ZCJ7_9MAGN